MESNQQRQSIDPIAQLNHELNAVMAMNQDACQEADALLKELAICEERLEYVDAALAESQRIAGEITSDAEQRVGKIVYNAQKVVMPHQELIAALNLEISHLTDKLAAREFAKQENSPQPVAEEKLADEPGEVIAQPTAQVAEQVAIEPDTAVVDDKPLVKRQYSLREPQEFEEESAVGVATDPEPRVEVESQPEVRWQYSMSNYQFSMSKAHIPVKQSDPVVPEAPPMGKRQYSMREPQNFDAEVEVQVAAENAESPSIESETVMRRQYSMIRPQSLASLEPVQEMQMVEYEENTDIIAVDEIAQMVQAEIIEVEDVPIPPALELESISPVVLNENHFDLDVTLSLRYFDVDDQMRRNPINPTWQVKVIVEVPRENETASYGKTFTAVTSTLYRYDDVILNDVYPFDLISPGTQNIGMYFYNCVMDSLSFMDLGLKEITLWDQDELVIKIDQRNKQFDQILLKGEDILEDIRSKVVKKQNSLVKDPSRGLLGSLFKN